MRKITPHFWFDNQAAEAAQFYTALFPNSKVSAVTTLSDTPSGNCDLVSFELAGQPFMAISAGPMFKFNPSISFHIRCSTEHEVDGIWEKLSPGGKILMPLDKYPFSARYGWLEDRYGVSWQVIQTAADVSGQKIMPALMFVGEACGRAEEAMRFYAAVFNDAQGSDGAAESTVTVFSRYGKGEDPDREGSVRYAQFSLGGQEFGAMDSAHAHKFKFNEAISFLVPCDNQQEIDYFWDKLSADPKSEQCGWLKDKFGVSWQIAPAMMGELMAGNDKERTKRITQAFLKMKKFDIAALEQVAAGAV